MSNIFISILSGLGGMLGWGTADFFANSVTDKIGNLRTLLYSQLVGLVVISIILIFVPVDFSLSLIQIGLASIAGIAYAFGYLLFYKGFEIGNVSVVSAVVNLQNLFIILIGVFIFGQAFSGFQLPAIAMLLLGVLLVSINFDDFQEGKISLLKGVKETLLSTIMFGVFFLPTNEFLVEQIDWLLVVILVKTIAITTVFVFAFFKKEKLSFKPEKSLLIPILLVGLLDVGALLSISYGVSIGDSIIILPISSSLTVVTITLAVIFLKEKLKLNQLVGIALAIGGIIITGVT